MLVQDLVFLPGMMLDEGVFASQIAALARYHPSVADLTRADSVEALAEQVLARAPSRFALVGLSMGGIVAMEIYRRAPERVVRLALLDTTPYADRPDRSALRMEQLAAVERGELAGVMRESMKPLYLAECHRRNRPLLESIMDMGLRLGAEVFKRQTLALRDRPDNFAVLATVRCPTLILCGREDRLCPPETHVSMAQAVQCADLLMLSGTGHLSPLEAPDRVGAALKDLMERTV
jgi:pimeloyl-ACP methyl ester carboxylesterase